MVAKGQDLPLPSPLFRRIPICDETLAKKVKAYRYGTPCCKCDKKLTERNAWEGIKWKVIVDEKTGERSVRRAYRLLCSPCARGAIEYYETRS